MFKLIGLIVLVWVVGGFIVRKLGWLDQMFDGGEDD